MKAVKAARLSALRTEVATDGNWNISIYNSNHGKWQ